MRKFISDSGEAEVFFGEMPNGHPLQNPKGNSSNYTKGTAKVHEKELTFLPRTVTVRRVFDLKKSV